MPEPVRRPLGRGRGPDLEEREAPARAALPRERPQYRGLFREPSWPPEEETD